MRKRVVVLLVAIHLYLWINFIFTQFGISFAQVVKDEITEKKPEGMSDLDWEKLKAKKPLPYDKGPSTIDVSKYPAEMQDIYENIFTKKCSKCHTIARAINAPYALPEEWITYIKKMMKKPGSGINPAAGKNIAKFLEYDSQIRKKDIIEKKLKEAKEKLEEKTK